MKSKKIVLTLIALITLAGIINCVLIEPALAYKDDPAVSQQEETHCCFICHSMHHVWISPEGSATIPSVLPALGALYLSFVLRIDPPVGSIFHPPLSL